MITDPAFSKEELQALTLKMREVANKVYPLLQSCQVHAFIEFNGLMQKYVDLCQRAADKGVDFTMFNTHNDKSFAVQDHDVVYLAEKFDCIFGPSFRAKPEQWAIFKEELGLP